jgi:hypothetical protein
MMASYLEPETQVSEKSASQDGFKSQRDPLVPDFAGPSSSALDSERSSENETLSSDSLIGDETKALSPIFLVAKSCLMKFRELSAEFYVFEPDKAEQLGFDLDPTRLVIEEGQARFKAWGSNIAAFRNGKLRTSLDFRLAEASGMKRRTLQVLTDLREYLNEGEQSHPSEEVF